MILSFQEVNRVLRPGGSIEVIEEGSFLFAFHRTGEVFIISRFRLSVPAKVVY